MALRAAKSDEDASNPCGASASALPPSFRSARSFTSEPVIPAILSPVLVPNRVFNGVPMALRATEMNEGAWSGKARNQ